MQPRHTLNDLNELVTRPAGMTALRAALYPLAEHLPLPPTSIDVSGIGNIRIVPGARDVRNTALEHLAELIGKCGARVFNNVMARWKYDLMFNNDDTVTYRFKHIIHYHRDFKHCTLDTLGTVRVARSCSERCNRCSVQCRYRCFSTFARQSSANPWPAFTSRSTTDSTAPALSAI